MPEALRTLISIIDDVQFTPMGGGYRADVRATLQYKTGSGLSNQLLRVYNSGTLTHTVPMASVVGSGNPLTVGETVINEHFGVVQAPLLAGGTAYRFVFTATISTPTETSSSVRRTTP
jgi:hypothetical protein